MGFLSTLFSTGLKVATGFLGGQLQAKQLKKVRRSQAKRGVIGPTGQSERVRLGKQRTIGPPLPPGMRNKEFEKAVALGATAIPAWHALTHASGQSRRRRMNVTNVKALTRALRRAEGFTKLVKRTEKAIRRISPPRKSRSAPARREIC